MSISDSMFSDTGVHPWSPCALPIWLMDRTMCFMFLVFGLFVLLLEVTLQGTNISHLGKRKIIFKMPLKGDMLVPRRLLFQASSFIRPKSVDYSGAAVQMVKTDFVERSSRLFAASSSSLFFLSASYRVPKATCKIEWHVDASAFNSSNLRK